VARYTCRIVTERSREQVFDHLSDFRTVAQWDPGVVSSELIGDDPGDGAVYDVVTSNGGRELRFRYRTVEFDRPARFTVRGRRFPFTSLDTVTVERVDEMTEVVYDARLMLSFPLSLGDRLLREPFRRIGDAAAAGLADTLDGEWKR